jgi:murein DD-endopeptidase MepM/ murein hydrolase activator NlpD
MRLIKSYTLFLAVAVLTPIATAIGQARRPATKTRKPAAAAAAKPATKPPVGPRLTIEPRQPGSGSLVRLTIDGLQHREDSIVAVTGMIGDEPVHFRVADANRLQALGAVPLSVSDSLITRVQVQRASGAVDTLHLVLKYPHQAPPAPASVSVSVSRVKRAPAARRLVVDRKFTQRMDSITAARIDHENDLARDVGHEAQYTPAMWTLPFLRPRESKVTSRFGSGRVFNGRVSSSHLGIDYRGAQGDPIYAANRGIVALVDSFFLAGNVVYIDHGEGVVTGYFHMSKPEVTAGDTVERGQEIGLVGATGRVTGPHLHWSARFGALTIDPADLLTLGAPFVQPDTLAKRALRRNAP